MRCILPVQHGSLKTKRLNTRLATWSRFICSHLCFTKSRKWGLLIVLSLLTTSCQPQIQSYHHEMPELTAPLPVYKPIEQPVQLALVLSSGGSKGMAHIGVLEELEKANIPIDLIVGCSAGAVVGALYAKCPHAPCIKQELSQLKRTDFLVFEPFTICHGLGHGGGLKKFLLKHLGHTTFDELFIPLVIVATDLCYGELVAFSSGPVAPTVHASAAYPFFFSPVKMYHHIFVDGGVIDPVPVDIAKMNKPMVIVAVALTSALPSALPSNLFDVAKRSTDIQFSKQSERCSQAADVIIKPDIADIGTFEDSCNDLLYEAGRTAALEAIPKIREALKKAQAIQQGLGYYDTFRSASERW